VVRTALVALAVVLLLLATLWFFQRRLIYLPSTDSVPPAAEMLSGARDVQLRTSDGLRLGAWFVPAEQPDRGQAVLVANGNAGNRAHRAPLARALADRGFAVLLFDYRGYGGNSGAPTERGLARDVRAAHRYLVEEAGFPSDRLVYFGESLGAAVVTELATEHPPAGLLLRSPFVDLASVGRVHYPFLPVRALLKDRYPLADQLATVPVPVTVVYGTNDSIIPPRQSRAVGEAALGSTRVVAVDGADHNDRVLLDGDELVSSIVELADRSR
jgi:alpha-beta hydrolase superfamily lysophospholipase